MTRATDCIVVGAGAIGMAIALELRDAGLAVTVIDRGPPGEEATSAAGGILAPQAEAHEPGTLLDLLLAGRRRWPGFLERLRASTGVDVGYRGQGTLVLAFDERDAAALAERAEWQRRLGLAVELLSAAELREREPHLSPPLAALRFPDDHSVDNQRLARALAAACARAGVTLERGEVRRVRHDGSRVLGVDVDGAARDAGCVIVAGGAWSARLDGVPLAPRAIEPVRGQMIELACAAPPLGHVVFGAGGYLVPRSDGRVLCGSTEERVGFAKEVTAAGLATLGARAARLCPPLGALAVARSWSGLRPAPPDALPLVGATEIAGLHVAAGHYRNGILLAPLTAELVAAIVTGAPPPFPTAPLSPTRARA